MLTYALNRAARTSLYEQLYRRFGPTLSLASWRLARAYPPSGRSQSIWE